MTPSLNEAALAWRARLSGERPLFGLVQTMAGVRALSLAAKLGFDFVILDAEHGEADVAAHADQLKGIAATGLLGAVRLRRRDYEAAAAYAAFGAGALLMAHVEARMEVDRLAETVRTPPGVPLLFAMIESREGVSTLPSIAAGQHLAGIIVGPNDLAADLGDEDLGSEAVMGAVEDVEAYARSRALALGSGVYPGFPLSRLLDAGHKIIVVGSDIGAIGASWRSTINVTHADYASWCEKAGQCAE